MALGNPLYSAASFNGGNDDSIATNAVNGWTNDNDDNDDDNGKVNSVNRCNDGNGNDGNGDTNERVWRAVYKRDRWHFRSRNGSD